MAKYVKYDLGLPKLQMFHFFFSSVLEGVLSALEHHGRGEKTTGKIK